MRKLTPSTIVTTRKWGKRHRYRIHRITPTGTYRPLFESVDDYPTVDEAMLAGTKLVQKHVWAEVTD